MKRTITQLVFSSFLLVLGLNHSAKAQQAPDFDLTDIDGNQHRLYQDYLDQGKTVLLSFGGAWERLLYYLLIQLVRRLRT